MKLFDQDIPPEFSTTISNVFDSFVTQQLDKAGIVKVQNKPQTAPTEIQSSNPNAGGLMNSVAFGANGGNNNMILFAAGGVVLGLVLFLALKK